jgi:hypothetical protein
MIPILIPWDRVVVASGGTCSTCVVVVKWVGGEYQRGTLFFYFLLFFLAMRSLSPSTLPTLGTAFLNARDSWREETFVSLILFTVTYTSTKLS